MDQENNLGDAVRRAVEHQQQHVDVHQHAIRRLFTELPEEHLTTLNDVFAVMAASGDQAANTAAVFHGATRVYLETRFNLCSACGIDHDKAAEEIAETEKPEAENDRQMPLPFPPQDHPLIRANPQNLTVQSGLKSDAVTPPSDHYPDLPEHLKEFLRDSGLDDAYYGPFLKVGETGRLNLPQMKMMDAYNLDDVRILQTHELLGFQCTKCSIRYQTIEDRMLKAPEDCQGCRDKSAWG